MDLMPTNDFDTTFSVDADNAELRHYRLARKSRYVSRCLYALECAVRLFVYCFNSRQLHKQRVPNYVSRVIDFFSPLLPAHPVATLQVPHFEAIQENLRLVESGRMSWKRNNL